MPANTRTIVGLVRGHSTFAGDNNKCEVYAVQGKVFRSCIVGGDAKDRCFRANA
jgi:hypothetical protein